jgi:hypothetical protein
MRARPIRPSAVQASTRLGETAPRAGAFAAASAPKIAPGSARRARSPAREVATRRKLLDTAGMHGSPSAHFTVAIAVACTHLACAYRTHHVPSLRDDPGAAAAVELAAEEWCRAMGEPAGTPDYPFTTDGCSCWPDGSWQDCCIVHDIAYWCGGSAELRSLADAELDRCLSAHESGAMGGLMGAGVRFGGHPWWPVPWRWGYGHRFPAAYYGLEDADGERRESGEALPD